MFGPVAFFEKRPLAIAVLLCAFPYAGLRIYLSYSVHPESGLAGVPSPAFTTGDPSCSASIPGEQT